MQQHEATAQPGLQPPHSIGARDQARKHDAFIVSSVESGRQGQAAAPEGDEGGGGGLLRSCRQLLVDAPAHLCDARHIPVQSICLHRLLAWILLLAPVPILDPQHPRLHMHIN